MKHVAFVCLVSLPACSSPSRAEPAQPRIVLWEEGVKNAYPRWSADGSRILYQSNRTGSWQLWRMDADGSHRAQLTTGPANNNLPDWSPDNRRVAFVSDRDGNEEVYVMDADGRGVMRLTENAAVELHPYWTPDGAKILFNSARDGGPLQIYESNPDGSGQVRLAASRDEETCARVSPDGKTIVYLANLVAGRDDVMMRRRDGSDPRNVTNDPAADGWPTWTSDGRHIVFASDRGGAGFALYVMTPSGAQAVQLTFPSAGETDGRPAVANDWSKIVFNRERAGTIGIFVMDVDAGSWPG